MKQMGLSASVTIYVSAAVLMYGMTKFEIPWLSNISGQETIVCWFVVAGVGIFTPMIITGLLIIKAEGCTFSKETWHERLRFRSITKRDIRWSVLGLVVVGMLSALTMKAIVVVSGSFDHTPAFMSFEPLTKRRYWILLVWLPYWILNILGEEFLWRAVMLPRQEIAFGKHAWIIHGAGWGVFHLAFGWQLLLTLVPMIFLLSYVVQRTKNSWNGVIMHAGLNGPGFVAIALGVI